MEVKNKKKLSAEAERSLSPAMRYVTRMHRFTEFYQLLVLCMGIVSALAIVVAIVANVLVGLCAAVAVAVLYTYCKRDALIRYLRLQCESSPAGLRITSLSANGEDTIFVPARLMGLPVTALGTSVFANEKNAAVTALYLPASLQALDCKALASLPALETVFFEGSQIAWDTLTHGADLGGIAVVPSTPYPALKIKGATAGTDGEVSA